MTAREEWEALAQRCREATGPNREIDLALARTVDAIVMRQRDDNTGADEYTYWKFTGSIDHIVSLIEKTLPGWAWKIGTCSVSDDAWLVPDFNCPTHGARLLEQFGPVESGSIWDQGIDIDRRPPGNVALALCEAYCEARAAIARKSGKEGG